LVRCVLSNTHSNINAVVSNFLGRGIVCGVLLNVCIFNCSSFKKLKNCAVTSVPNNSLNFSSPLPTLNDSFGFSFCGIVESVKCITSLSVVISFTIKSNALQQKKKGKKIKKIIKKINK
jgi:hypothetical protein